MDARSSPAAEVARASQLLRTRRYAEAWPLYRSRRWAGYDMLRTTANYPEWSGEDPAGKHIAVVAEQGFGDQIMFGRWLPELVRRGARVTAVVNPFFLSRLFETMGVSTKPSFTDRPLPPADFWVYFGDLPHCMDAAAPVEAHYLPIPTKVGGGVGVMASGSPTHANDANRSLSASATARLRQMGRDLSPAATGAVDFLETAEIVATLDLVVTVDTALAHLAGALGKRTCVLLPHQGMDWRWNDGVQSDWYPSFRLFKQPPDGDWHAILNEVEAMINSGRRQSNWPLPSSC